MTSKQLEDIYVDQEKIRKSIEKSIRMFFFTLGIIAGILVSGLLYIAFCT